MLQKLIALSSRLKEKLKETEASASFLFDKHFGEGKDGLHPTVTIRQIMWALKMKPIPRERWETCFDRRDI